MALIPNVLRTCGLLLYLIFYVQATVKKTSDINIQTLKVGSIKCDNIFCKYLLNVTGGEFLGHYPLRLTSEQGVKGSNCDSLYPNYELKEIETSQWFSTVEVSIPISVDKIFFCVRQKEESSAFGGKWVHQGNEHFLEPKNDIVSFQRKILTTTESPKSTTSQDQENDSQVADTVKDINDENNEQKDIKDETNTKSDLNDVQETNKDWADLTHDIDVNYLPSVTRPSREERNYIEVLFNRKYVPLSDMIDTVTSDSEILSKDSNPMNSIKTDVKNNLEDVHVTIQEDKDRNTINNYAPNHKVSKSEYFELKRQVLSDFDDKSHVQSNKCDKFRDEIIAKLNLIPTVEEILTRVFADKEFALNNIPTISKDIPDIPWPKQEELKHNIISEKINPSELNTNLRIDMDSPSDDLNYGNRVQTFLKKISTLENNELLQNDKNRYTIGKLKNDDANGEMNKSEYLKLKHRMLKDYDAFEHRLQLNYWDKFIEDMKQLTDKLSSVLSTEENVIKAPNERYVHNDLRFSNNHFGSDHQLNPTHFEMADEISPKKLKSAYPSEIVDEDSNVHIRKPRNAVSGPNPGYVYNGRIHLMSNLHDINLDTATDPSQLKSKDSEKYSRKSREMPDSSESARVREKRQFSSQVDYTTVKSGPGIFIDGLRIEDSDKEPKIIEEGIPSVLGDTWVTLRLYGEGLSDRTVIAFTHDAQPYAQPCKFLLKGEYKVVEGSLQQKTALFRFRAPPPITGSKLYICAKNLQQGVSNPDKDEEKYAHMGTETWKMLACHQKLLPLWVSICLILVCLMFSALFSGLNLGLMSLDRTELKIISNTGTEQERKYARAIMPVRDHGNYLLCSILLGNVAVNSTFTILLDELTSGLFAVIFSTLSIVLLGEITPQAICSRHGLMVGAKSIMVTKGVMALTAPLSFPVSKLLDYFLGEEIGNVYNRERLKELVKVTTDVNDLDKDEVNIISGALEMRKKTVSDVMTKLEDVFMLPISSVLDFETMSEIVKSGYSRIPVYEGGRGNIVTVLFIKDLAFVDPDDNTPLRTLCQYYQNPCNFVFEDVTLDVMFKQFKDGHKGHMAFVHRINNEGEGDPFYETIGLVTLEDVIEEMIQSEIVDETDVFLDNRSKRRRRPQNKLQDFAAFAERHENQRIHISPQLTLATFQFLSTSVDAFRPDTVSETVLRRLLKQDVIQYIKMKGKTKKDPTTYVFQQGKPVDYFLLILEGRVEVTVGRENLVFEAGPFTYFGVQALTQNIGVAESPTPSTMGSLQNINMDAMLRHTFVPDYSVRAITSLYYLTVKRSLYMAAKRATLMEKGNISKGGTTTQEFDTEVDKKLCNSSTNLPISMLSRKLLGKSSTASTRDDAFSSTSGVKQTPRVNIIELLQVSQPNYPSSERMDVSDKYLKRLCNTASLTDPEKSYATVQCSNAKTYKTMDSIRRMEASKSTSACSAYKCLNNDVDATTCTECVRNKFWASSVLNKDVEDGIDSDRYKKKKATFHKDSSLLSFRNLSSTSHQNETEYNSNRDIGHKSNREIGHKSNLEIRCNDIEFDPDCNRGHSSKYRNYDFKYSDVDFTLPVRNERYYLKNQGTLCQEMRENLNSEAGKSDHTDYVHDHTDIKNTNVKTNSNFDSNQLEYKPFETDSSNQEHKSNQEIDSTEPPDSIDRFLELERDTIDYEKEFREEKLTVERRRLETEQIMIMQLSKIIKMLEMKQK